MKCCVSTDVGTWTNSLTFEPDLDYNPDAGTGLLSSISYKRCNAEFYVGKIPRTRIAGVVFGASRGFKMVLFTEGLDNLCQSYMRSAECPSSSALLLAAVILLCFQRVCLSVCVLTH